jgi:hypothetical protein
MQYLDAVASGATRIQYTLTGGLLSDQTIATATPTWVGWGAAWNSTTVANGSYTLTSVASYPGGPSAPSAPITITVSNAPPSTTVVYPSTGATLDSTQNLYFDAVASPGVTQVTIELTNEDGSTQLTLTTIPTIVGWIGVEPGTPIPTNGCGPIYLSFSIQSVASYAGGVKDASAPVPVTIAVYASPIPGGGC